MNKRKSDRMSSDAVEELLKRELKTDVLKPTGKGGGGCISAGIAYETKEGKIFVKFNKEPEAKHMFTGEFQSLQSLMGTCRVRVPRPIQVLDNPEGGAMLVMEYLDFHSLRKHSAKLGEQLAILHQHNSLLKALAENAEQSIHISKDKDQCQYVSQFGFPVPTCCGFISQDNTWLDSWQNFYARRIDQNVRYAEKKFGDREVGQLWSAVHPHLPKMFTDLTTIEPALLHGDLWGGNAGEMDEEPVVFDPASFYGHAEFDLAIAGMFGGFSQQFFAAYHAVLPKQPGFKVREDLYQLFHYLNHWNHFGGGYKSSTLSILRSLANRYK